MNRDKRQEIFTRLREHIENPRSDLEYRSNFELLIAVLLSAQATDISVNKATAKLYPVANTPQQMLALGEEGVREHIKTIGLFNSKAKNVIATCQILVDQYDSQVPESREALEALPGVGRKTANVVLNIAFGHPTIAVDTHIYRVSNRTADCTRKKRARGGKKIAQVCSRRIQTARPSLADTARSLHLHRAQAAVRELRD